MPKSPKVLGLDSETPLVTTNVSKNKFCINPSLLLSNSQSPHPLGCDEVEPGHEERSARARRRAAWARVVRRDHLQHRQPSAYDLAITYNLQWDLTHSWKGLDTLPDKASRKPALLHAGKIDAGWPDGSRTGERPRCGE